MTIPLQSSVVYGPVLSRRLGRSLGVNLLPLGTKICNFNCVYCQYGTDRSPTKDFPDARDIIDQVEEVIGREPEIDHITFSGNGEPTLHPKFSVIVDSIKKMRDVIMPHVPIALLTNGTGFRNIKKREALRQIDKVIVKLDAGNDALFQRINQPADSLPLKDHLKCIKLQAPLYTQTCFFENSPGNCDKPALAAWYDAIKMLKPRLAQVYSLDRPTDRSDLRRVGIEQLREIARQGQSFTGVRIKPFGR